MENIQLFHGDCLEIMRNIPDKSLDMIFCDLPYGTTIAKWDEIICFDELWKQYERIIKDNGVILLFGVEPFASKLRLSNLKMYKYDWHWHKSKSGNFLQANKRPHKKIETISVFYKKQPNYFPIKINNPKGIEKRQQYDASLQKTDTVTCKRKFTRSSEKYESDKLLPESLIYFANEQKPIHPTQKPVALLEYLIKTYTNQGETVLDNCMGCGSTGIACLNTNRRFIGIELDEKYFEMAKSRIENHKNIE